jgi:endo-1,4-beta-xylanase
MISFSSFLLASSAVTSVLSSALPDVSSHEVLSLRSGTPTSQGTDGGCYYNFWTDGSGDVVYTNKDAGGYNVTWSGNVGNFLGGRG